MKCMISFSSVVLLLLIDHQAMGASFSLQAQLIGAQGKLDPSKTENVGSTAGFARTGIEGMREEITAPGFGVNMAYKMTEAARVNGTLAWVNFDEGNTKPQYMDASAGVNASYDVYASNDFAIYGLGGVSYHWIDLSDLRLGDEKIKFDNLSLVNYDVGLGTRVELTPSVRFDIAYRYGDTLQKDNVKTKTTDRGTIIDGKFKDIALIKNELAASVGYQF